MLATLNDKNDPHDAIEISPEVVRASRTDTEAPTLAPEIVGRLEPKIEAVPPIAAANAAASTPSVDAAVRAALSDFQSSRKRSPVGKWLRGAMLSMLFAGGSAAAAIGWQMHGDMVQDSVAAWIPALAAAPSRATPPGAEQATQTAAEAAAPEAAAATEAAPPAATTPAPQQDSAPVTTATPDIAPSSVQAMARDLATMGQQIEQLKANIAELKAGQEQMARELAKAQQPRPAEARAIDPRNRVSALPPHPPVAPVRKPKPAYPPAATSYAPAPTAPPAQAAVVPPPPAAVQTADDDGPVVRPPMPVR
jgi:hypothetical protein